jgi:hypothetical protein
MSIAWFENSSCIRAYTINHQLTVMIKHRKGGLFAERLAKPLSEFYDCLNVMCVELAEHEKFLPAGYVNKFRTSLHNLNASLLIIIKEMKQHSIEQKKQLPPEG